MKNIPAKKSLGQNFLINEGVQYKIIDSCQLDGDDVVLEIGPGKGALTRHLANCVKHVYAVEKDDRLATALTEEFADNDRVTIINNDIIKQDFSQFSDKLKVVGNLPYNMATPIIEKIIEHRTQCVAFYFMVQLEHGLRITAKPNCKDYGSFSCFVQFYADVKKLFNIKNSSFQPMPKVQSCFVQMIMLPEPRYQVKDEEYLFQFIRSAFNQRRKTIRNSFSPMADKESMSLIEQLGIDLKLRPENVTLEQYVAIVNTLL